MKLMFELGRTSGRVGKENEGRRSEPFIFSLQHSASRDHVFAMSTCICGMATPTFLISKGLHLFGYPSDLCELSNLLRCIEYAAF